MIYERPKDREANRKRGLIFDEQERKRKEDRARRSIYDPVFERITSTAMLHHALALSCGVPVDKLAEMIDLKAITLEGGPGVQIVTLP